MESRANSFGHPIHQLLIVLPFGTLATSIVADVIYLITYNSFFAQAAFFLIMLGIVTGLFVAIVGFWDWVAIPCSTRAKSMCYWSDVANIAMVVLFAVSWSMRRAEVAHIPTTTAFVISLIAISLGTLAVWFGGELADRRTNPSVSGLPADSKLAAVPSTPRSAPRVRSYQK